MARGMSKAAKAAGYDALAARAGRMELVLHDIACGVAPDFETTAQEIDGADDEECLNVSCKLYRVHSGDAGLVLLRTFSTYSDGRAPSTSDVRVVRIDDMWELAGGEGYFRNAYGRAVRAAHVRLGSFRRNAYGLEVTK